MVLFFVTTGTNLQWVAVAATAGPSAVTAWIVGALLMFLPLSFCVLDLSARHPEEGGIYVWSKRAFGDFAGFLTGWTYWCSNLPYFPGLLYFTAANALYLGGDSWRALSASPTYFITASLLGLALATWLNLIGLNVGKWLNNVGGITRWLATLVLIGVGLTAWWRLGSATPWSSGALRIGWELKDLLFWSTIAFAWTGPEAASFMGDEIQDARRTVGRGFLLAAPMIALIYVVGTVAILAVVPAAEVDGLQGVLQAIRRGESLLGLSGIAAIAAVLITITCLGSVGAWLEAVARLPFVVGLDHYLPERFAHLHPRWGTPHVALLTQAAITVVFVLLGQAGTTVKGAYDVLVSMTFLVTFIPFLFVFAAAIRLQRLPRPAGSIRLPGGRTAVVALALVGFLTTLVGIVLTVIPRPDDLNPALAVTKIVGGTLLLLGIGAAVYFRGRRRLYAAR